jgi:hypothetical protein
MKMFVRNMFDPADVNKEAAGVGVTLSRPRDRSLDSDWMSVPTYFALHLLRPSAATRSFPISLWRCGESPDPWRDT